MKKILASLVAAFSIAIIAIVALVPAGAASAYEDPAAPLSAAVSAAIYAALQGGATITAILQLFFGITIS